MILMSVLFHFDISCMFHLIVALASMGIKIEELCTGLFRIKTNHIIFFCFLFSDNSLKDTATKDKSPLKAGALGSKKMVRCHVTPFNLLNPIIYLALKPKPTIVHCPNPLNI